MAAMTQTAQAQNRSPMLLIVLLLILLAAAGATVAVRTGGHAVARHGADAIAIREACDSGNIVQIWRSASWRQKDKFFRVCQLDDGRLGVQIIRCVRAAWVEITAFVPSGQLGDGTMARVLEYLSGQATPFRGKLSDVCR